MILRLVLLGGVLSASSGFADERQGAASNGLDDWPTLQAAPFLDADLPLRELRTYVAARVPKMSRPTSVAQWQAQADTIRADMLDKVVFRGEAARWRDAKTRVEWLDSISGGSDYVIRKFRYEALPGMWFPGLLYEPTNLANKAPVFINVNGHDELGKATPQTQLRCINLAKRGGLAFLLEFLHMGQLRQEDNRHNALVQLDLCGTSGVAPFILTLTRGLEAALAHPNADTTRVGVAGLSGGGWQTIMLASLDKRITLANPVAGYASMVTRAQYTRDIGDAEQIPSDMCTVADYSHLTALMAPRPLLLTYNAKDECCFLPEGSLPPLEQAAWPIYRLYDADDRIQTHINHEPGTHNFEGDNREAFYRIVGKFFFPGDANFNPADIPIPQSELKTAEELAIPLPPNNATLHGLAVELSQSLPKRAVLPSDATTAEAWRSAARERLRNVIRLERYTAQLQSVGQVEIDGIQVNRWLVSLDDEWTVPAVELASPDARAIAIVFGDQGRGALNATVKRYLMTGHRVLTVDLLGFGETNKTVTPIEWQMIATVGRRPLGIQAAQLVALAKLLHSSEAQPLVKLVGVGPRASVVALVTAAVEPQAIAEVELQDSWHSVKEFINRNFELKDAPELGCFGLLYEFDIPQLEAMVAPRIVTHVRE